MWDQRYSEEGFAYGTEPNDFLRDNLPLLPLNAKCLFLAEGEGRNAVWMAQKGYKTVTAVDSSAVGLEKAQRLAAERGVSIATECVDLASYDLGESAWDFIVGISCHLPPPIRQKVLDAVPKALKPGGYFLLECYTPAQLEYKTGGPPVPELMYSSDMLTSAFENKLEIERNAELVRNVVEGRYHTGKAAVVQFLAKKPEA